VTETSYLGLGSNLGDRLDTLQRAVELLDAEPAIGLIRCSRVWETDPVGGPPQPDFLNVVVRAEVGLEPRELLATCQRVEAALGRVRDVRWGPRTVDIDILLIDALLIDEEDLTVPHPRMHERAFVLMPLLDIEPDITLPNGTRLLDVPLGADAAGGVRPFAPPLRLPHRSP
jgi:2-amino-4-hydroxy-6-hydroxymethyldihydropteridine diphosphokinase